MEKMKKRDSTERDRERENKMNRKGKRTTIALWQYK